APDYVEPVDWNKALLGEAERRRIDAARTLREAANRAYDAAGVAAEDARRKEVRELSIDLAPDDADLRRAIGDVEVAGHWEIPETGNGRAKRREFEGILAATPAVAVAEDPEAIRGHWKGGAKSERFTAWGD